MTKSELIALVASVSGTTAKDAESVLDSFRDVVQAKVKVAEDVSYPGLGKFSRTERKARIARNPQTGEPINVAATVAPKFTASAAFKNVVKGEVPAPTLS